MSPTSPQAEGSLEVNNYGWKSSVPIQYMEIKSSLFWGVRNRRFIAAIATPPRELLPPPVRSLISPHLQQEEDLRFDDYRRK